MDWKGRHHSSGLCAVARHLRGFSSICDALPVLSRVFSPPCEAARPSRWGSQVVRSQYFCASSTGLASKWKRRLDARAGLSPLTSYGAGCFVRGAVARNGTLARVGADETRRCAVDPCSFGRSVALGSTIVVHGGRACIFLRCPRTGEKGKSEGSGTMVCRRGKR